MVLPPQKTSQPLCSEQNLHPFTGNTHTHNTTACVSAQSFHMQPLLKSQHTDRPDHVLWASARSGAEICHFISVECAYRDGTTARFHACSHYDGWTWRTAHVSMTTCMKLQLRVTVEVLAAVVAAVNPKHAVILMMSQLLQKKPETSFASSLWKEPMVMCWWGFIVQVEFIS